MGKIVEKEIIHKFYNKKTGKPGGVVSVHAPRGINLVVDDDCWIGEGCRLSIVVPNSMVSLRLSKIQINKDSALNIKIGNECSDFRLRNITLEYESVLDIEVVGSCGSIRIKDYYSSYGGEMWVRTMNCCSIDIEDVFVTEYSGASLRVMDGVCIRDLRMVEVTRLVIGSLMKSSYSLMYRPDILFIEGLNMEDEADLEIRVEVTEMDSVENSYRGFVIKDLNLDSKGEIKRTITEFKDMIFSL